MKFFPNQKKNEFRDILSGDIQEKETDVPICEGGLASNGYVVNTLESVLWCILNYDNYEEAVLGAVNLGEDTDTVGALVGGLAAILWEVPEKFTNKIRNKEIAEKIIKN